MITIYNVISRILYYYQDHDTRSIEQILLDTRRARRLERYKKYNYVA